MYKQDTAGVSTNNINVHTESGQPQPPSVTDIYAHVVLQKLSTMQKWFILMCFLFLVLSGCLCFVLLKIDYAHQELQQTTILMKYNLNTTESAIRALHGGRE